MMCIWIASLTLGEQRICSEMSSCTKRQKIDFGSWHRFCIAVHYFKKSSQYLKLCLYLACNRYQSMAGMQKNWSGGTGELDLHLQFTKSKMIYSTALRQRSNIDAFCIGSGCANAWPGIIQYCPMHASDSQTWKKDYRGGKVIHGQVISRACLWAHTSILSEIVPCTCMRTYITIEVKWMAEGGPSPFITLVYSALFHCALNWS